MSEEGLSNTQKMRREKRINIIFDLLLTRASHLQVKGAPPLAQYVDLIEECVRDAYNSGFADAQNETKDSIKLSYD